MEVMSAVRIHGYGGPELLTFEEAPRPGVGDEDVLIRVLAASIDPFDAAMCAGYMSEYFETRFRYFRRSRRFATGCAHTRLQNQVITPNLMALTPASARE